MFATMALLPPLLQRLYGNLGDRHRHGAAAARRRHPVSMQLTGILVRRGWDGRMLLSAGFLVAGISLWEMSLLVARDPTAQHMMPRASCRGSGMGMVFIPRSTPRFRPMARGCAPPARACCS
jgi:DHA2 family multidrug resistance protein